MNNILTIFLSLILSCATTKAKKSINHVEFAGDSIISDELDSDTTTITLEYYGWGCPCPQWITPENKILYELNRNTDSAKLLGLFWNIKPINDSIKTPFELLDSIETPVFEFKGRFYKYPQLLGDEGEMRPAKTILYHSVKKIQQN